MRFPSGPLTQIHHILLRMFQGQQDQHIVLEVARDEEVLLHRLVTFLSRLRPEPAQFRQVAGFAARPE